MFFQIKVEETTAQESSKSSFKFFQVLLRFSVRIKYKHEGDPKAICLKKFFQVPLQNSLKGLILQSICLTISFVFLWVEYFLFYSDFQIL